MGIHRGPNIVKDNLVFGYDTGYGVADNNTATRFYPGEPTTNQADTDAKRNWGTHNGAASSTTTAPEKGPGWKKLTITNIYGTNYRLAQFPYLSQADGTSRTYSVEFDVTGLTGYFLFVDGNTGYSPTNISGRGRYSLTTGTISGTKNLAIFLGKSGTHSNINDVIYYKEYQVEEKPHASLFTDSTRSDTTSLIDLKKSTDIDVSNVSFDSTGQPTFDGTNDSISLTDNFDLNDHFGDGGDFSIEAIVYMRESASQNGGVLANQKYQSETDPAGFGLAIRSANTYCLSLTNSTPTSYQSLATIPFNVNNYHHIVYTFKSSTGNVVAYSNGSQYSTVTNSSYSWNIPTDSTRTYIGYNPQGGWGNYINMDIPVIKVYNNVITEQEVNQNFNAYKNRFNI